MIKSNFFSKIKQKSVKKYSHTRKLKGRMKVNLTIFNDKTLFVEVLSKVCSRHMQRCV